MNASNTHVNCLAVGRGVISVVHLYLQIKMTKFWLFCHKEGDSVIIRVQSSSKGITKVCVWM